MSNGQDPKTPFLGLTKPVVGAEEGEDLWGGKLNINFDLIDAGVSALNTDTGIIHDKNAEQDSRLTALESADTVQDSRLDLIEIDNRSQEAWLTNLETWNTEQDTTLDGKVSKTGDTMSGPLLLPAASPTDPAQATTKAYVDGAIASGGGIDAWTKTQSDARYVDAGGDSMTGPLVLPGDPVSNNQAATKSYVDNRAVDAYTKAEADSRFEPFDSAFTKTESDARYLTQTSADSAYVNVAGDTMTGALTLPVGSQGTPALSFTGATNYGWYYSGATVILSTAGATRYSFASGTFTMASSVTSVTASGAAYRSGNGTATAPTYSFSSENTLGMYRQNAGVLAFSVNADKMTISTSAVTTTVPVVLPGNPANPLECAPKQYVDLREPAISAGTVSQYWRGDKSWQTLDKAAVGLGNVDNTSDASKPVSTAQATADGLRVLKAGDTMTGKLNTAASTSGAAGFNLPTGTAPSSPVAGDLWYSASVLYYRGASSTFAVAAPALFQSWSARQSFLASTTSSAGITLPHGVAPTAPNDGDLWTTTAGMYARINGATVGPLGAGGEPPIAAGTVSQYWRGDKTWQTLNAAAVGLGNVSNTAQVTSVTGTAPVVSSGGTTPAISMAAATTSVNGYLTAADWNTFNGKAPLASPTFTGVPAAPTATAGTNTTQLATTAFVSAAVTAAGGASPSNTNPLQDGAAAPGTSALYARGDHVHPTDTSRAPLASPVFTGDPQAPTPATTDNDTSIATTAFVKAQNYASGAINLTFRNRLINGDMRVSQRGTSFASPASASFTLDRWLVQYDGTGAFGVYQMDFNLTNAPARYGLRWQQTGAVTGGTYRQIRQAIEGVETLAGSTVTVSFMAYVVTGTVIVKPALYQYFGSGGSPSADVSIPGSNISCTGQGRYAQTFTVPPVSGKTRGTAGNDWFGLYLSLPVTGTFDIYLWDIQLEEGPVATPFERRPMQTELGLCQRYYQKHNSLLISDYNTAGGAIFQNLIMPVTMRASPSAAFSQGAASNTGTASLNAATPGNFQVISGITATGSGYRAYDIALDAEL